MLYLPRLRSLDSRVSRRQGSRFLLASTNEGKTIMKPIDRIVVDIETATDPQANGGWGNLHNSGIGVACVYSFLSDSYQFYDHTEDMRQQLIARILQCDEVFGFMIAAFDFPVIFQTQRTTFWTGAIAEQLRGRTFDLWRLIATGMGRSPESVPTKVLNLNSIALSTLGTQAGRGKTMDAADAPTLFQRGDAASIGKLYGYVLEDVRLERDLAVFALKHGYVIGGDGRQYKLARDVWHPREQRIRRDIVRPGRWSMPHDQLAAMGISIGGGDRIIDETLPMAESDQVAEQIALIDKASAVDVRPAICMNCGTTAIEAGVPLCGCSIEEVQAVNSNEGTIEG